MNRAALQKTAAVAIVGCGIYLLAQEFVAPALLLLIFGAALFNGAKTGQWLNFVCHPEKPGRD